MAKQGIAEIQYSPEYKRLEIFVPYGTKLAQVARIREKLFTDFSKMLPRGCQTCLSGESLLIREELEHVLRVDLDTMNILERR